MLMSRQILAFEKGTITALKKFEPLVGLEGAAGDL